MNAGMSLLRGEYIENYVLRVAGIWRTGGRLGNACARPSSLAADLTLLHSTNPCRQEMGIEEQERERREEGEKES